MDSEPKFENQKEIMRDINSSFSSRTNEDLEVFLFFLNNNNMLKNPTNISDEIDENARNGSGDHTIFERDKASTRSPIMKEEIITDDLPKEDMNDENKAKVKRLIYGRMSRGRKTIEINNLKKNLERFVRRKQENKIFFQTIKKMRYQRQNIDFQVTLHFIHASLLHSLIEGLRAR